jgi:hypothetical protein
VNITAALNSAIYGGAVFARDTAASYACLLQTSVLSKNNASRDGGGVFLYNSKWTLNRVVFTANHADRGGGGALYYQMPSTSLNPSLTQGLSRPRAASPALVLACAVTYSSNSAAYSPTLSSAPSVLLAVSVPG